LDVNSGHAETPLPRVVVVGAGFAGLAAARGLDGCTVRVAIVDRRNFHLFQPLLYQVATAALNPSDIAFPIRTVFRGQPNVEWILLGEVESVDAVGRTVRLDGGERLEYDVLVLAPGAGHAYFGHDEWAEHAPGLKTVEDALVIRRRVLEAFELAERRSSPAEGDLTFVVIGGGPTGVELAGAVAEIAVHALEQEFDRIDPATAEVILIEAGDRVLPGYPPRLSASARGQLEELGVEVVTGVSVRSVDGSGVELSDGRRISAAAILWAAGIRAAPLLATLGGEVDGAGRVRVALDLSLPGHPEVFVVGDGALVIDGRGRQVPGVAPAAIQQGRHVARQIRADLAGRPRTPFRYRNKGMLATIGRARAVAALPGLRFSGLPAWLAWMAVHIYFLIGVRNRLLVFVSWAWNYLTFRRGARIITEIEGR
jgi:NADH:ubiquinone reductase (H+-translocating)